MVTTARPTANSARTSPTGLAVDTLEQHYTIDQLNALWLPAAFQPVSIDPEGASPRYERSSSTLIVDTKYQNSDQLEYDVTSEIPARPRSS